MPKISVHGGPSNAAADVDETVVADGVVEDAPTDLDGDGEVTGYEEWTKDDLSSELERRGLTKTGNKADLVARLTDDDEYEAEEVAEPASEQDDAAEGEPAPAG